MAGKGFAPKDADPEITVSADGEIRGPDLPALDDEASWPAPTLVWWEHWRRSPQSQVMGDTDWDFLLDTALLHARFHAGDASVAGELRLRVAKFGATPEDRARLKMAVEEAKDMKAKPRTAKKQKLRVVDPQAS